MSAGEVVTCRCILTMTARDMRGRIELEVMTVDFSEKHPHEIWHDYGIREADRGRLAALVGVPPEEVLRGVGDAFPRLLAEGLQQRLRRDGITSTVVLPVGGAGEAEEER